MGTYIIGYTLIGIVVLFITFSILVKKKVLFGNTYSIQKIFGAPLLHYSIRRIGSALISVTLAIIVTFFLLRAAQPAQAYCDKHFADPHVLASVNELNCNTWKANMGYDGSIGSQLVRFFYAILPFPKTVFLTEVNTDTMSYTITSAKTFVINLGRIYEGPAPDGTLVSDYIIDKMFVSFRIGIFSVILELALGYPFGILMAKYQNGIFDKIGKAYIITIDAIPGVAYYYIWMSLLCGVIGLPYIFKAENPLSYLPAILTSGFTGMAGIGLWVRRYMVDEFNSDYVKFARSKGLSERRIMGIHILRNAIVPLVRTFPSAVIGALMGSYFLEAIYGIPGLGGALLKAVNSSNACLLQGLIIISAYLSIISYLLGDIVTAVVDPRISFSK